MTSRGSIWSIPGMPPLAIVAFTGFCGYAVLLPVAPLWAVQGGADTAGAGLVNFVLLGATVATQFFVPRLIRAFGWGHVLAVGMVLLGVPALLHGLSADLGYVLGLSAVRGIGFGLLTVPASAAPVLIVPPRCRGAAVGAYALALSIPTVALMPAGSWAAQTWGFWPVFVVSSISLAGIPACYALSRHLPVRSLHYPAHPAPRHDEDAPSQADLVRALAPSTAVLLTITLAGGAVITFAPQVVRAGWLSAAGLFALALVGAVTRWRIGAVADRVGAGRLLWPFVAIAVVGLAWIAWQARSPLTDAGAAPWIVACALVGMAYGGLQNLTMLRAFEAAGPRAVGAASAVWNAGFDTGTAVGSVLVGGVAAVAGFGAAFAVPAVLCLAVLPLALPRRPDARRTRIAA